MASPFRPQLEARRARPAAYGAQRAIVASAARVSLKNNAEVENIRNRSSFLQWQQDAWAHYNAIGEIKFAFGLVASVMSRLRLYAGVIVDPESPPVPVAQGVAPPDATAESDEDDGTQARRASGIDARLAKEARDMLAKAFARTRVPDLLRAFALNVTVPGECYLVLSDGEWAIRSTSEIRIDAAGRATLQTSVTTAGRQPKILPRETTVGRIWRPDPQYSADPDSSMRGVAGDCEELLLLSRMIRSEVRARLNAGIVYIPDEITVASRSGLEPGTDESEEEIDPIETELIYSLTEPINSETSGPTVIPMLLRGPAELGDKIKHISLGREADEFLIARADRTLERILQGIDVPKDVVTGLANVKYSNAIQIDENLYKAHVEPLALVICDAVTDICLRPLLRAAGWDDEDVAKIVVWYDPSEVVTRPDRAADADNGYDRFLLSASAWRTAHGFGDTDAPDEEELARRLALEKSSVSPEVATALFAHLLPTILGEARAANTAASPLPTDLEAMLNGASPGAEIPPAQIPERSVP